MNEYEISPSLWYCSRTAKDKTNLCCGDGLLKTDKFHQPADALETQYTPDADLIENAP